MKIVGNYRIGCIDEIFKRIKNTALTLGSWHLDSCDLTELSVEKDCMTIQVCLNQTNVSSAYFEWQRETLDIVLNCIDRSQLQDGSDLIPTMELTNFDEQMEQ